jgi:hypothetical protein
MSSGIARQYPAPVAPVTEPRGLRWWFENRQTGAITVGQFPNWPLFAIAATWVARAIAQDGSRPYDLAAGAATVLWIYWGADELIRGVNPWRRLLGTGVIVWQVVRLA